MKKGILIISLDFELFWGIHDAFEIDSYYGNVNNVKIVIPQLLELFKKYQIHSTFAAVGAIYHHSFNEFKDFYKDVIPPNYEKKGLSPYEEINLLKEQNYPELHFAPDLIEKIRETGQEIGTHTYSHYYCTEKGIDLLSFESDIRKALEIAKANGDIVKSIIFPRNQIGDRSFIKVLKDNGIIAYRGNPYDDFSGKTPLKRLYRFATSYLPILDETVMAESIHGVINVPASHFLRPYTSFGILNRLQLYRIKRSMRKAAIKGKIYHLWWHPHNMGSNVDVNMKFLESILVYYQKLNKKFGMKSLSMIEAAENFMANNK